MILIVSTLLGGCSFFAYEHTPCKTNEQCVEAFGFGYSCLDSYCEVVEENNRCTPLYPLDVFENPLEYKESYRIGILFDGSYDFEKITGAEIVINELANLDGIDGTDFIAIQCSYEDKLDDNLVEQDAVKFTMEYLSGDLGIPLIIGPAGSDDSVTAYDIAEENDTVLVSPSATAENLTIIDGVLEKTDENPGLFWRTVGSDGLQAMVLSSYILKLGSPEQPYYEHIVVINQKSTYAEGFATFMLHNFASNESIETHRFTYDEISEEPWLEVSAIDAIQETEGLTAVVFLSDNVNDMVEFINDIDDRSSYENIDVYLPDAGAKNFLLSETNGVSSETHDKIRGSRPAAAYNTPAYNDFQIEYHDATDGLNAGDSVYSAFSYDAAWVGIYGMMYAHFQGDPTSGKSIAKGLRMLTNSDLNPINISSTAMNSEVKPFFKEGYSVNINGASGNLDFDPETEETSNNIEIWVIDTSEGEPQFGVLQTCNTMNECFFSDQPE